MTRTPDPSWIEARLVGARPRVLAALLRWFRDLDLAEEAFQEACLRALKNWPEKGPPQDAAAWLIMVGRNAALDQVRKARRLRRLPSNDPAFDRATETDLAERLDAAIARKSPAKRSKAGQNPRPPAALRMPVTELPDAWQSLLRRMRLGALPMHQAVPAASVIDNMEESLREYAAVQRDVAAPVAITVKGLRRFEAARAVHAAARESPAYPAHGNRPATRHTAAMRLWQFGEALGLDPLVLAALRNHENSLRRQLSTVVPLKFGRLDNLPGLSET